LRHEHTRNKDYRHSSQRELQKDLPEESQLCGGATSGGNRKTGRNDGWLYLAKTAGASYVAPYMEANNLQQSWRFDWEPPKAVLRDVWTIDWILDC
jgi:hypothetical protein